MNIYSTVDFINLDKIIILFNSVITNSSKKSDLKFYILTDKISGDLPYIPNDLSNNLIIKETFFDNNWKILLEDFNDKFYKGSNWCKHDMNFARFLFFKHFPEVDRVIYLDWDMVVISDIFELENEFNKKDKMIVATTGLDTVRTNIFTDDFRSRISPQNAIMKIKTNIDIPKYKLISDSLDINLKDVLNVKGFNAGFYIVSNNHFQEKYLINLIRKLIKIQTKFNCFNFGTQVVMNLMHLRNRIFVDKKWNNLPNNKNMNEINIVHYNGLDKPWNIKKEINNLWYSYCKLVYPDWEYSVVIDPKKKNKDKSVIKNNKIKNKKINNSNFLKLL